MAETRHQGTPKCRAARSQQKKLARSHTAATKSALSFATCVLHRVEGGKLICQTPHAWANFLCHCNDHVDKYHLTALAHMQQHSVTE
eukprot:13414823-Alexandrium_andersonii.AAC.1